LGIRKRVFYVVTQKWWKGKGGDRYRWKKNIVIEPKQKKMSERSALEKGERHIVSSTAVQRKGPRPSKPITGENH